MKAQLLASTAPPPMVPKIKVNPKAGAITLSAYIRREGEAWTRVSRTIDQPTRDLILKARGVEQDVAAARALGIDDDHVLMWGAQMEHQAREWITRK